MSTADACQIQSNPDIDGIDDTTYDSWWSTLVTALSLQLAGLSSWSSISLYHAILITWLSFPAVVMSFSFFGQFYAEGNAPFTLLVLTYVHLCSFVSFTIWAWATAPSFPCSHLVHLVIFGQHVRVTGWIRYIILPIMGIWVLAVAGASIIGLLFFFARIPAINRRSARVRSFEATYIIPPKAPQSGPSRNERALGGAFASFAALIFATVMAELMVASHGITQDSGSAAWGFGQIVAMILLLTPIFTVTRVFYEDYMGKNTKPLEQRPLASLWRHIRQRNRKSDPELTQQSNAAVAQDVPSDVHLEQKSTSADVGKQDVISPSIRSSTSPIDEPPTCNPPDNISIHNSLPSRGMSIAGSSHGSIVPQ